VQYRRNSALKCKLQYFVDYEQYVSDLLETDRWQRLAAHGARPQRLLFASTGTKDPQASDVLYIGALAAPNTVNTMPEETLLAFDAHGQVERALPRDGGDGDATVAAYGRAGIDVIATATPAWQALAIHYDKIKTLHLREMFAKDPGRGDSCSDNASGLSNPLRTLVTRMAH
jgi:hypothetical protein